MTTQICKQMILEDIFHKDTALHQFPLPCRFSTEERKQSVMLRPLYRPSATPNELLIKQRRLTQQENATRTVGLPLQASCRRDSCQWFSALHWPCPAPKSLLLPSHPPPGSPLIFQWPHPPLPPHERPGGNPQARPGCLGGTSSLGGPLFHVGRYYPGGAVSQRIQEQVWGPAHGCSNVLACKLENFLDICPVIHLLRHSCKL